MSYHIVYTMIVTLFSVYAFGCNTGSSAGSPEQTTDDTGEETDQTDTETETGVDAGVSSIWVPSPYDLPDSQHPYQTCEEAVATGEAPMISDFDDGMIRVLPNEGRDGGYWYTSDDGSDGSLDVDIESGALHIVSRDWSVWGAGVGVVIGPALGDTKHCVYDAGHYIGVRFKAKGNSEVQLKIGTFANYPLQYGGACERSGENCFDWPMAGTHLTDEWQTHELAFCLLEPQGWGGEVAPLDPSELIDMFFMIPLGQDKEIWLDELEFFTSENAEGEISCEKPCPLDLVPHPETVVPESSYLTLTDELTLHTFDQETTRCGSIRRRYLSFVPEELGKSSDAPVLIALHGSGSSAESFQDFMTNGRLDELAKRDGAIVVYGNAAPGRHSSDNPDWPNSGSWRQEFYDDGEVDDVVYLEMVIEDMMTRDVISGDNDLYLIGMSNGGGMILKTAKERPEMFSGIAPFMAFDGWDPAPVPNLEETSLRHVLFGYAPDDPGLSDGYHDVLSTLPAKWAAAMGLPSEVIENPIETTLPNSVNEGENYSGDNAVALRTRNSYVNQLDFADPDVPGRMRILEFIRGGHFWPTPRTTDQPEFFEMYGFTNQDLDASDAIWDFFSDK